MTEKRKILCLIGQLGNGGSERQLATFLKYLNQERFEATVLVSSSPDGTWYDFIAGELNLPVLNLGKLPKLAKLARFRTILTQLEPDVVFCWSFFTNAFGLVAGKVPFISALRGDLAVTRRAMGWFFWRQCLKGNRYLVNSNLLAEQLQQAGIKQECIKVIFNIYEPMTEVRERRDIRRELQIPEDRIVVTMIGRDAPQKNLPFFVDVMAAAMKTNPQLHGLLIGSGGAKVKAQVEKLGLSDRFTLPGQLANARQYLPAADIYFLSSKGEGMPNSIIEAVDAGCAILSTEAGGIRDILGTDGNQAAGVIIDDWDDVSSTADALCRLAADGDFRKQLSHNAKKRLDIFSPACIMSQYEDFLMQD